VLRELGEDNVYYVAILTFSSNASYQTPANMLYLEPSLLQQNEHRHTNHGIRPTLVTDQPWYQTNHGIRPTMVSDQTFYHYAAM